MTVDPVPTSVSRRAVLGGAAAGFAAGAAGWLNTSPARAVAAQATPVTSPPVPTPDEIIAIVEAGMTEYHLKAAIARVVIDGTELVTVARGETMTGIPATSDMHFRNGAVAIAYVATALLVLVDQGVVGLDDKLSTWLPDLPDSEQVTLRMLANMTAGYTDYVNTAEFAAANYADSFRTWTPDELIAIGLKQGRQFAPGANWAYAHTNIVILGQALEAITKRPLADLLRELVLDPLGLVNTVSSDFAPIPEPVLHAFTSERKSTLKIAPEVRFYEESTFWNPSWTLASGSIQTSTIADITASAAAIGEGTLLSPESHAAQTDGLPVGFGSSQPGCELCRPMTTEFRYGLGVFRVSDWLVQNPSFSGFGAVMTYLPARKLAIAVSVTVNEDGFDDEGNFLTVNASQPICRAIAAAIAPESPIPG